MTKVEPAPSHSVIDELMTPAEVGRMFGVTAKTASRWADEGQLDSVKTLGGNRRFIAAQVRELYAEYLRKSVRASAPQTD
jgi:excisionase family DNA binding protein